MSEPNGTETAFTERLTGPFAPEAYLFAGLCCGLAGAGLIFDLWIVVAVTVLGGLFGFWFFRNPKRSVTEDELAVIAPADGRIVHIGEVELPDGTRAHRIGIFLSIFDVHVNCAPVTGWVRSLDRTGDRFVAAFRRNAHLHNVRLEMVLETSNGAIIRVVQISGWIARRIVCHPNVGELVRRGVRYGMIRFGSRTDVILPIECELEVELGERVWGGKSVIARLAEGTS